MGTKYIIDLTELLERGGLSGKLANLSNVAVNLLIVLIIAWIADFIIRKVFIKILIKLVRKTTTTWDDILLEKKVFVRLAHIIPALIVYNMIEIVLADYEGALSFLQSVIFIYLIVIVLLATDTFLNSLQHIYETLPISRSRPIKGFIQVLKMVVYFIAVILILSVILDKSPSKLLAGLGAMAAILLLVFKDTILGFVASIQLSANRMVHIGDWITMPNHGADGDVIEVTLNTVKEKNFDKTIITIPTYALVSESFKNWRGMQESGGRRIKRHINIDMKSVIFCDSNLIEKFGNIQILKEYIKGKQKELDEYNQKLGISGTDTINARRLTNIGVFRKYIEFYLTNHPKIHNDMTFLVRQLQPTDKGIPIEIYVFSNSLDWAKYENIQSDIFDHLLAVIPEFDLRVFQNPSGDDFRKAFG